MRHFFTETEPKIGQVMSLSEKDSNHLLRVLRAKIGKKVSLAYKGSIYEGTFTSIENSMAQILVNGKIRETENTNQLILCQGVPKGQKLDDILMHCTEVGVDQFYLIQMERSVSDLSKKFETKKIRFKKIIEEAAKQSNRSVIPQMNDLITIKDIFSIIGENDLLVACYEDEEQVDLEDINFQGYENIYYIVGPEGGFSINEIEVLREKKAVSVSLGNRILRTETAGVVAGYVIKRRLEGI